MLFRSRFLSTAAYSLAPLTDAQKEAVQKQRDSIEVQNIKKEEPEKEVKEEEIEKEEIKEEGEVKEEIKTNEEKVEELEEEKEEAETDKDKARIQKRIDKLTAKSAALARENEDLKRQLAAKPDDEKVLTEDEVERRSEEKANQKAALKELNASIDRIVDSCKIIDKNYKLKIDAMCEEAGSALPSTMIGILDDLDKNGGPVLMYLANNVDEYEEIYKLHPAKMALKLKEIEAKTKAPIKKKEISKVPEPKDPLGGKGSTPETKANEKDDMDTFVMKRNREVAERRKARMGMH